jgi:hypothetical protein
MATQQAPILEKQVKLDNTVGNANYTQAYDSMALTPTALGEFGSKLALTASTTLAQKRGYEAGLDPHGSLLPPITATDKAYANAYVTQAQNTLGLQATKMMNEGQAELAKAWKLTPEMLASYTKNMSEGLNDIINNAPMQAQPGLAAQFNNNLMQSSSNLNLKMIGQQKQQALQNASLFNNSQLQSIYEASRGGNVDAAQKMHDDMIARSKSMLETGMITPLQNEATAKSARMSMYSGLYSGEAVKAFQNKKADQFLADLLAKKPEGMNTLEWESIAKNVMGEVSLQESFQQRNETSLYSEANRILNEGTLTPDFIAQLEAETTDKAKFNNFMGQVAAYQRKHYKSNEQVASLMPQWTSPYAMAVASNKVKNMGLVQAGQDIQQRAADKGRTLDDFEAQAEAMATAGGPIQNFTQQMNAGFLSGNPQLMTRNLNAYRALRNSNPKVLDGMSKQAEAMMTNFESQLEDGNAPDVAAQNAKEIVQQKTPEQMEINTALVKQWESSKVNTPSRLNSWASQFADLGDGAKINNLPYFAIHAKNIFKSNMELLNGDIEGATKMTKEGIDRAWGVTNVNGKPEFVFQPIEKTIGLDEGANPLIKHDLYEQIQKQIAPMKMAYDEGQKNKDNRMSFYYRLAPRPSYEEFKQAQTTLASRQPVKLPKTGLLEQGNIDLTNRPQVKNEDGSISTVRSMSANIDGKEVLLPTVSEDGKILSDKEAIAQYKSTGKHLGKFDNPANATAFAKKLHQQQEQLYLHPKNVGFSGTPLSPMPGNIQPDEEWDNAINLVNQFKNEPIKIEKVYSDKRVEPFEIAIQANPGLQQDAQGVIGSYNVSMRMNNGPSAPMSGWFAGPLSEPVYMPNQQQIQSRYFELVGLNPSGMSAFEMNQRRVAKKKFMAENNLDDSINRFGRSFR